MIAEETVAALILAAVAARGPGKSVCPSEVAKILAPDGWRPLLGMVRMEAMKLADAGRIVILRKGRVVKGGDVRGVIRLAGVGSE